MKRAVLYAPGQLVVEDAAVPDVGPGMVGIAVSHCGICGSDVHIYHGRIPARIPQVMGHELSGRIAQIGPGVTGLAIGDRVVVDPSVQCGSCSFCRQASPNLCPEIHWPVGGFAEYTVASADKVYVIPDCLDLDTAALAEPASCCLRAIDLAGIKSGESVLIVGGGAIGLIVARLAVISGAGLVMLSEPVKERRDVARQLGVDVTIDSINESLRDVVSSCTDGLGVDVAIEAVGNAHTVRDSIEAPRRGGRVVVMGVAPTDLTIEISPYDIYARELSIRGSNLNPYTFERTVRLLPRLGLEPVITRHVEIEEVEDAIRNAGKTGDIKVLVDFPR